MAMLNIEMLRRQHQDILVWAANLRGLGGMIQTRDDAWEAREAISRVDWVLSDHLRFEDDHLYPALMDCQVPAVAAMALDCAEEMGGLLGAWIAYRNQWTASAILADPQRFDAATAGVIGALVLRIERENTELYQAASALAFAPIQELYAAE